MVEALQSKGPSGTCERNFNNPRATHSPRSRTTVAVAGITICDFMLNELVGLPSFPPPLITHRTTTHRTTTHMQSYAPEISSSMLVRRSLAQTHIRSHACVFTRKIICRAAPPPTMAISAGEAAGRGADRSAANDCGRSVTYAAATVDRAPWCNRSLPPYVQAQWTSPSVPRTP